MGGKNSKPPKIPHYYMSMHYGICHGPIDSINQLFIKEIPVFCGNMTTDGLVVVNQPELFGGETKEGGPVGVIEVYLGSEDQVMSNAVASRFGLTSETMPAYRGIANLFFRGEEDIERDESTEAQSVPFFFQSPFDGAPTLGTGIFDFLFGSIAESIARRGGFKWMVNNPYLPSSWASVTRIGKSLSADFATIYPAPDEDNQLSYQLGSFQAVRNTGVGNLGEWKTLSVQPITDRIAESGVLVKITLSTTVSTNFPDLFASSSKYSEIEGEMLDEDLIPIPFMPGEGQWSVGGFTPPVGSVSFTRTVDPRCRYIRVRGRVIVPASHSLDENSGTVVLNYSSLGESLCSFNGDIGARPDMNPAHILYECQTNTDWGAGASPLSIDTQSYLAAAETLFNERFGLSMRWMQQSTIGSFEQEVLDHINATKFIDPSTGLWTLKLIRGDYDPATLDTLDPSNCEATNRQRISLSETVNEVIVEWTNPATEETETISAQDGANLSQQGGVVVSRTRPYYGVRNARLATELAFRDLRAESFPIFTVDIKTDRRFSNLRPGSVVKFSWPEDGIVDMVLRVKSVDYGKPGKSEIRLTCAEDVYGLGTGAFAEPMKSLWQDETVPVQPLAQAAVLTAPLPLLLRSGFAASDLSDNDFPRVINMVFGNGPQVEYFSIAGPVVQANGSVREQNIARLNVTPSSVLQAALQAEPYSTLPGAFVRSIAAREDMQPGDILMLGLSDTVSEFLILDQYNEGADLWLVCRGIYDTVPAYWEAGSSIWYIGTALYSLDPAEQVAGDEGYYKLLPKMPSGSLLLKDAEAVPFIPTDRPYAPSRVAGVKPATLASNEVLLHPTSIINGSGTSTISTGWTASIGVVASSSALAISTGGTLGPFVGARYFYSPAAGTMEQTVSVPNAAHFMVDEGSATYSLRWRQASITEGQGALRFDVVFLDAAEATISQHTGAEIVGALGAWFPRTEVFLVPPLTRHIVVRAVWPLGGAMIDDITLSWGSGFSDAVFIDKRYAPTNLTLTWGNRNRLTEDTVANFWDQESVTPEVGQTNRVRVYDTETEALVFESDSIAGSTYNLPIAAISSEKAEVKVITLRDGFESIQSHSIRVYIKLSGYGYNYGQNYGN